MPERPIRVRLFKLTGRKFFYAEWNNPETGRKETRSTGCERRRDAEKFRAKLEAELAEGEEFRGRRTTWKEFRERVERDFLPEKRPMTRVTYRSALNALELHLKPKLVTGITSDAIDELKGALRATGIREATVASYLRHVKVLLTWGHRRKIVATVPNFDMPGNIKAAKGRPLTDKEFAVMLATVPKVVGDDRAASWAHLIRGLWASGLRISEAVNLTWDNPELPRVDIDRPKPMLFIPAAYQKAARDTVTPIVPEFLALLRETLAKERRGFVFNPRPADANGPRPLQDAIQKRIAAIGKAAGILVKADTGSYASSHDLRRTFCYRWSRRVLPQVLRTLARHRDVATTLTYYSDADANMTFDAVYDAMGASSTDSSTDTGRKTRKKRNAAKA